MKADTLKPRDGAARAKLPCLMLAAYALMFGAAVSGGEDFTEPETAAFVGAFALILAVLLSRLPALVSWGFIVTFSAVALYLWWPQTVLWRLQHVAVFTTQDERDDWTAFFATQEVIDVFRAQQDAYERAHATPQ